MLTIYAKGVASEVERLRSMTVEQKYQWLEDVQAINKPTAAKKGKRQ